MKTKNIQRELIESANQIREKYRALKKGQFLEAEQRINTFQPLIEPLQELKSLVEFPKYHSKTQEFPSISTPSRIPVLHGPVTPKRLDFGILAAEYLGNYLSKNNLTDTTYGIRREGNKFYIGNREIQIANDDILIDEHSYTGTKGLWELLTLKRPTEYNKSDLEKYKEILEITNGHLKGHKAGANIMSNAHYKYTNIIKPLFKTTGEGMREVTGNKIDYIYWNDPNEIINRLRLLWLSKQAGNTGVDNEINAIIEELRESGIIY